MHKILRRTKLVQQQSAYTLCCSATTKQESHVKQNVNFSTIFFLLCLFGCEHIFFHKFLTEFTLLSETTKLYNLIDLLLRLTAYDRSAISHVRLNSFPFAVNGKIGSCYRYEMAINAYR